MGFRVRFGLTKRIGAFYTAYVSIGIRVVFGLTKRKAD
jgi:hypothetical protein